MNTTTEPNTRLTGADSTSWDTFDLRPLLPASGGLCLDLGCGLGARRDLMARGFQYIGLDRFAVEGADVLGDASALPFANGKFDLIVAASSFEHFADPWAAAREIFRVLNPSGCLVASLSFLEPYHARSYFHMTHLGARRVLEEAGLKLEIMEPFEWTGPEATAQALFQFRPARWLVAGIVRPALGIRRFVIKTLISRMRSGSRRRRAEEFLEEERFRFTAGIKIRARRSSSG